jgi:acetolactate synthase-1/2/3 large subunit
VSQPSSNCAAALARTLRDAGITRMFGLPGGEILEFIHAAKREGIEFLLTRHEAAAAFAADVTGQIDRRPGVCVSTLGPGAINMTLGVANAYLDRSPVVAVTATMAAAAAPFATHQNLDLNAVYRPFTKAAITLDGRNTAAKVRRALAGCHCSPSGLVHIAVPSATSPRSPKSRPRIPRASRSIRRRLPATPEALASVAAAIQSAKRPVVALGLDLHPRDHFAPVRAFVDRLGVPVFVTPKVGDVSRRSPALLRCLRRRRRRRRDHGSSACRSHHRHRLRARGVGPSCGITP